MARGRDRQKRTKAKPDPVVMLALSIVPAAQVRNGQFEKCDISNHAEEDQRHMVRSGERRTIRRLSHLERLEVRGAISQRQRKICEWYAEQHEKGFAVSCPIANYSGAGGNPPTSMDLLAKTRDQFLARQMCAEARASISPTLVSLFERVVLGHVDLGNGETWRRKSALKNTFRLAVDQLDEACGHLAGGE